MKCRINRPDTWLHQPASHRRQRKPLPRRSRPHTALLGSSTESRIYPLWRSNHTSRITRRPLPRVARGLQEWTGPAPILDLVDLGLRDKRLRLQILPHVCFAVRNLLHSGEGLPNGNLLEVVEGKKAYPCDLPGKHCS